MFMKQIKQKMLLCLLWLIGMGASAIPNNTIYYTSTSMGKIPVKEDAFNVKITSHVFTDGQGVITFQSTLTSIEESAFNSCSSLTSIELPSSLKSIGNSAFERCEQLKSIVLPNAVTKIGNYAFAECRALKELVLSNALTDIGACAFTYTAITSVELPQFLQTIGESAFFMSNIKTIFIPKSVSHLGVKYNPASFDNSSFVGCDNLTSIVVDEENPYYDSRNNCNAIIETATNTLVSGCRATVIPNTVEVIGPLAFSLIKTSFTSLEIPSSVKEIGYMAFSDCSSLASLLMHSISSLSTYHSSISASALINLELIDAEHPFVTSDITNLPTFSTVKYTRTLANGKYGTIILPFVPENADDFVFYTLDDCKNDELTFKPVQTVEAGVPYLYKNADGCSATEMTASNVDGTTLKVTSTDPSAVNGWQFKGNYANTVLNGTEYYVISNNQFVNTTANVNMIPFRAYLQNVSASAPKSLRIIEDDGEVTCISAADVEGLGQEHGTIYDLSGRRVANSANLKGIYIINGKKVLK